jgi:phosphoribosylformylglycinamidine synthase
MSGTQKVTIHIFLKNGVLDVQGKAVEGALHGLGWNSAAHVRVGKVIELELEAKDADAARAEAKAMCEKLLANTVIESYRIDIA